MADALAGERRVWPRVPALAAAGTEQARLRPGRTARLVDLSPGGALIETDWRLLPGTRVEMHVGQPVTLFRVVARILRSQVALLDRERIRYRGALMFEQQLSLGEPATPWVEPGT